MYIGAGALFLSMAYVITNIARLIGKHLKD
jgi:hypothetical protein